MTGTERDARAQRTFLGLLSRPLVTAHSDPELYRAAVIEQVGLQERARRAGYRFQHVGGAVRLTRVPLAGTVAHPPSELNRRPRRLLALTCLLAAACEDLAGTVTLARLSDAVAELSGTSTAVSTYDPDQLSHRRLLVRAAAELETWGVLTRRAATDRVEEWTERHTGIGAGFEVNAHALLMMTSPDVLAATLTPAPVDPDQWSASRTQRLLRMLLETPAVLYADLDLDDAHALRVGRGLRAGDLRRLVGGRLEDRAEGVLMRTEIDGCPVTVHWPAANTGSWVALLAADSARLTGIRHDDGSVTLTHDQVTDVVTDLVSWRGEFFTAALRDNPDAVRAEAERHLLFLGLLRLIPDPETTPAADPAAPPGGDPPGAPDRDRAGWWLSPVTGRFRDPDVVLPAAPNDADPAGQTAETDKATLLDGLTDQETLR